MRIYENSYKTSENRLKPRSWYIPEKSGFCSLNGEWRFKFYENGDKAGEPQNWDSIDVPSCWQIKGYENPNYVNIKFPFPCDPPYVPDINPLGMYEKDFEVCDTSLKTYVVFEGVSSHAEVYVNGIYVGFTQGSRLMAEFDLSNFVSEGINTLRVYVRKWSCGNYLECQDAFRYSGIFRNVYILSRPKNHIFDLNIKAENNSISVQADSQFSARLYDGGLLLCEKESENGFARFDVENPKLWTAETPYLYKVVLCSHGETITRKIGFRTVCVSKDNELLVNGNPVKLKGVNHHDTHPQKGWTMSEEDYLKDLKLMKELNINTIRTSHYPPCPKFLDYCDELGFYVILETDLETHGFAARLTNTCCGFETDSCNWPCSLPEWKNEFIERMSRAYERDKIHTCVIMWSTGNESGFGDNQREMMKWIKERDNTRLIHCEDASKNKTPDKTDVFSMMYPSISQLKEWVADKNINQPVFMCEYAHAMGNGPGSIWDYWEAIYSEKKLIGGCIWEWADHTVLVDGVQKYGGDFKGELVDDKNCCCDGMVFSDRTFKAGTYEIKNTYAPFRIKWDKNALFLKNCFDFISFSEFDFEIAVSKDGEIIEKQMLKTDIKPKQEEKIVFTDIPDSCILGVYITVRMFDKNGFEIGCLEEKIPVETVKDNYNGEKAELKEDEFEITVSGDNFKFVISKQTGSFVSIIINGEEQLLEPVKLSYFRAPTDNDKNLASLWGRNDLWNGEGFDCAFSKIYSYEISENKVTFNASASGVSHMPFFRYKLTYEFFADGKVKINLCGKIADNVIWLPRLGFEFILPSGKDKFEYYGNGPLESYTDMVHHGTVTYHKSCADDEYVNYVFPQEHGNHTDCKYLKIVDSLEFSAEKMDVCVLHNSTDSLALAKHTDELEKSDKTYVRVDYKNSGIGSASCGPELDEKYRLSEKEINFDFVLSI